MAYRPPRTTLRRPQAPVSPVYEEFKPISEWKHEEETDILLIYLPGFLKDQIRVTTEGRNSVRVRGERLVAGNKWNSFVEDFQVPENCNIRGIHAKFEGGILTVTMPKKSTSIPQPQVDTKVEGKKTQQVPPTPNDPKIQADIPPKPSSSTTETKKQMDAANEPKSQKGQDDTKLTSIIDGNKKADPLETIRNIWREKGQGEQPPARPTTSGTNTDKQENIDRDDQIRERKEITETKGLTEMLKSAEKFKEPLKPESEVKPISERGKQVGDGSGSDYKEEGRKHISKTKAEETTKVTDSGAGAGAGAGTGKEPLKPENEVKPISERGKQVGDGSGSGYKEEGRKHISKTKAEEKTKVTDSGAGAGGYNLESYKKKVVEGLVKGLDEERQLMMNVGVAVLVIVALGAYVYFTYGSSSSRKPEN